MKICPILTTVGTFLFHLIDAAPAAPAFSGDFVMTNLVVDSPFQANTTSTTHSSVEFDFCDQDTPEISATHCNIHWEVGLTPSTASKFPCGNKTFHALIPDESYMGVTNFMLNLSHTYIDNSIGDSPYNKLSKYGHIQFMFPNTTDYECDLARAHCQYCNGSTIIAPVTEAWS